MTRFRAAIEQHRIFCFLPLLMIAAGCTNLEFLEPNTCGNLVVESDAGEDCDGVDGCGAPGSANACRYTCAVGSNGCPTDLGFQCGADFICRRPTGQFSIGRSTTTETARDLIVGDVNADGCAEVIVTAVRSTTVNAFASDRSKSCIASAQTLKTNKPDVGQSPPLPILRDVSPDDPSKKQSLISAGSSVFGDGLSLHFANETPTLFPVLFPRSERAAPLMRPLKATLLGVEALVILEQRTESKTDIVIQSNAQMGPEVINDALPGKIQDIATIAVGDILTFLNDSTPCDELVVGMRGSKTLDIYQLCSSAGAIEFAPGPMPKVTLDGKFTIRNKNARVLLVDVNGDGKLDLATNGADESAEMFVPLVAYGVDGGRFHSNTMPLPNGVMPDGKALVLNDMGAMNAAAKNTTFVAVEMDANHPGVEFYNPPCPVFDDDFTSPSCGQVTGDCEAVVVDIDNDGDQDVVVSEGQGVDLAIHRQSGGTFNVTFLETTCPPHYLGAGDFDADGINDVAFFDQAKNAFGENETALSIVYGNALAAPSDPVISGNFSDATGLAPVQVGPVGSGTLIAATRGIANGTNKSALGIIEIGNERAVAGPWYLKPGDATTSAFDTLRIVGLASGSFSSSSALLESAVVTLKESKGQGGAPTPQLWLVTPKESAELLDAYSANSSSMPCQGGCMMTAVPTAAGTTDNLLILGTNTAILYKVTDNGFTEGTPWNLDHTFSPQLSTKPPARDNVRPFVGKVDNDDYWDVLVLATNGALVGFFGDSQDNFEEVELLPAPKCWQTAGCGNYIPAMLNIDGDKDLELVIAGSDLLGSVNKQPIVAYDVILVDGKRTLVARDTLTILDDGITKPEDLVSIDSDYFNLGAGDVDGDGVTDLVFMPSSNFFTILRGVPVHQ